MLGVKHYSPDYIDRCRLAMREQLDALDTVTGRLGASEAQKFTGLLLPNDRGPTPAPCHPGSDEGAPRAAAARLT